MSTAYKILVGDTDTPQARIPKSGEQTYLAPVIVNDAVGVENCFEIEVTVQQSGTAGYTGLQINVTEASVGTGAKKPIDMAVGGVSKFSVDNTGLIVAPNAPISGNWTPSIPNATMSGSNLNYGRYTRIGNTVILTGVAAWSARTAISTMKVSGLPYSCKRGSNGSAETGLLTVGFGGLDIVSVTNLSAIYVVASFTTISMRAQYLGGGSGKDMRNSDILMTDMEAAGAVQFSLIYETDDPV